MYLYKILCGRDGIYYNKTVNYIRIFLGISMKFCWKISLQQIFMLIPQENREWGFKGGMVKGHGLGCRVGPEMRQ